jgi:hypothetical protein
MEASEGEGESGGEGGSYAEDDDDFSVVSVIQLNESSLNVVPGTVGRVSRANLGKSSSFPRGLEITFTPGEFELRRRRGWIEAELWGGFERGYFGRCLVLAKADGPVCLGRGGIKGSLCLGGSGVPSSRPMLSHNEVMHSNRVCIFPFSEMENLLPNLTTLVLAQAKKLGFDIPTVGESLSVEINFDGQAPHSDGKCTREILAVVVNLDDNPGEKPVFRIAGDRRKEASEGKEVFELAGVTSYRVTGDAVGTFRHYRQELKKPQSLGRFLFIVVRKICPNAAPKLFQDWPFREWAERLQRVAMRRNKGIIKDYGLSCYADVWSKPNSLLTETGMIRGPIRPRIPSLEVVSLGNLILKCPLISASDDASVHLLPRGSQILGTINPMAVSFLFPGLNLDVQKAFSIRQALHSGAWYIAGAWFKQEKMTLKNSCTDLPEDEFKCKDNNDNKNTFIVPQQVKNVRALEYVSHITSYLATEQLEKLCCDNLPFPVFVAGKDQWGDHCTIYVGQATITGSCPSNQKDYTLVLLSLLPS